MNKFYITAISDIYQKKIFFMRHGIISIIVSVFFLFGIYAWSCSSTSNSSGSNNSTGNSNSSDSKKDQPANPSQGIFVSTKNAVPLYKDIHSACTVDIFYTKRNETRNILEDPYFSFVKSLNFNSLQYSGGSTADNDHVIVGDTAIYNGKGDGYNIREADLKERGEDINTVLDGVGNFHFGKDFFNEYAALVRKLGIRGDVIANVQSGTLDELYWKIKQANAQRVIFGMEQNLGSNAHDFADGNVYKEKISKWIIAVKQKFPDVITVIDVAPVYNAKARGAQWNDQLKGMEGDEARLYLWDKDYTTWLPDQNANLAKMNEAFTSILPGWFNSFREKFPDKNVSVWQWGLKPKTDLYNTMAACIYIGKFYKFMIDYNKAHENFIGYASYMSLKSLNRGDGSILNHYYALEACGLLFKGNKNVVDLRIDGVAGLSGVACSENGKTTLLLINESGKEINLPSVSVDGVLSSGKKYNITSVSAASLGSFDVSMATNISATILLKGFSVSVVEF
jgi:hypothetical protein